MADLVQVASNSVLISKARLVSSDFSGVCVSLVSDVMTNESEFVFSDSCFTWTSGVIPLDQTELNITSVQSLMKEGVYCYDLNCWKRIYVVHECCCRIQLVEDVPEECGQKCIWMAGVVMAHYLEAPHIKQHIVGRNVLELGSGSGLPSLVSAALGVRTCVATEQPSCIDYLRRNVALNPDLSSKITISPLLWGDKVLGQPSDHQQFDVILACDVTYDTSLLPSLLLTIKQSLAQPSRDHLSNIARPSCQDNIIQDESSVPPSAAPSFALLCHDNNSCPISKYAPARLTVLCKSLGLRLETEEYSEYGAMHSVNDVYASDVDIFMWRVSLAS